MENIYSQMSREIRKNLNITQKTLAKKLNISRSYLSEIETGSKFPSARLKVEIRTLHLQHCAFRKPKPLVEVMTPEQPRKSLFQRIMGWFRK